jgi:DNA polymerase III subunit delta'
MAQRLMGFSDILGQQPAIDWLRAALSADRLPHGLIFAGPVGVGKATTARALATIFLCERPANQTPCGKCESCAAMAADVHPDFHVVYRQLVRIEKQAAKARDLAADVIRDFLIAPASLKSNLGRGKVFVVEEADLMNATAQNALLKTLEEPAGRTLIVLLTDQPDALLPTIRSRCQLLRFSPLDEKRVRDELTGLGRDHATADEAARFADGSLGIALRWLEDGVIDRARDFVAQLDTLIAGQPATWIEHFLRESADAYAETQLKRDPLASKDQATREGLGVYLRIASDHFRRRLPGSEAAATVEQTCAAIDEVRRVEQFLDANVNIPLILQHFAVTLQRCFASPSARVAAR